MDNLGGAQLAGLSQGLDGISRRYLLAISHNSGKSQCLMEKLTLNSHFFTAMLDYQRVVQYNSVTCHGHSIPASRPSPLLEGP